MATTIATASLLVNITETITLDGKKITTLATESIPSIRQVTKRIVTVTNDEVPLILFPDALSSLGSAGSLCGAFASGNVRYGRITNKDNSNHILLFLKNENGNESCIKVDYGQSFIIPTDLVGGTDDTIMSSQAPVSFTDNTGDKHGSTTIDGIETAKWAHVIQGMEVSGDDIPVGAYVASVTAGGASYTLSAAATDSTSNDTLTYSLKNILQGKLTEIRVQGSASTVDVEVFIAST